MVVADSDQVAGWQELIKTMRCHAPAAVVLGRFVSVWMQVLERVQQGGRLRKQQ